MYCIFYCPSLRCFSRVPFKELSLRMQIRFTSAATQRPESRREGEEGRFSYQFKTKSMRQRKNERWGEEKKIKKQGLRKESNKGEMDKTEKKTVRGRASHTDFNTPLKPFVYRRSDLEEDHRYVCGDTVALV